MKPTQQQQEELASLLENWVAINSGSDNLDGLALMLSEIKSAFEPIAETIEEIELPPRAVVSFSGHIEEKAVGKALKISCHPNVETRVLLVGHMDTVFDKSSPFQSAARIEENRLHGPGAADMKGGLIIMLEALKILESSSGAGKIGWDVIITPDEEVGSPSSRSVLIEAANAASFGLIFEPSLPDGKLVSARKGSTTLSIIVRGRAAHVGRDANQGRSAIVALAHFISHIDKWRHVQNDGTVINFGQIHGGTATNIVPELAICKAGIRTLSSEAMTRALEQMNELATEMPDGITVEIIQNTMRPPKPFDAKTEKLFQSLKSTGNELGMALEWEPTGGVCDGNLLAAAGLPNIDTLGAIGGKIHTHDEYIELESLTSRSLLTARFLENIAIGKIKLDW